MDWKERPEGKIFLKDYPYDSETIRGAFWISDFIEIVCLKNMSRELKGLSFQRKVQRDLQRGLIPGEKNNNGIWESKPEDLLKLIDTNCDTCGIGETARKLNITRQYLTYLIDTKRIAIDRIGKQNFFCNQTTGTWLREQHEIHGSYTWDRAEDKKKTSTDVSGGTNI